MTAELARYGLTGPRKAELELELPTGTRLGRVLAQHRGEYSVVVEGAAAFRAAAVPELVKAARRGTSPMPIVGDWVACDALGVCRVLPRTSVLSRKAAGRHDAQEVAANVDLAFIVTALFGNWNARRAERFFAMIREGGVKPVLVLTKADLVPLELREQALTEARSVAGDGEVIVASSVTGEGLTALQAHLTNGLTVALFGSSGVGKSTLVNLLLGEERQTTREVREDGKGRHTTTVRELVPLPSGAVLLDNPGIRELGLWDAEEGVGEVFPDVEAIAMTCRFRDCTHRDAAGCAVAEAVARGELTAERVQAYVKLRAELDELRAKTDSGRMAARKADERRLNRALRARLREKDRKD
jgi:ribosome biogenesis GTPase